MKNKYIILIAIVAFTSCKKGLDRFPLDRPSNETFYSSKDELIMAVNASYNYLAAGTPIPGSNFEWPWIPTQYIEDMVTDILATRNSGTQYWAFKTGSLNPTSALPANLWRFYYEGVNRTNSLIGNMGKAEAVTDATLYKRIRSEARVIRAYCYMNLIQKFGDVPLVTENISTTQALELTRTAKKTVLEFIYKEFDEAVANLPASYSGADKGRLTKGAAYALKARIALYNGDWAIAKKAAKDCMDLGVYKLYSNYRNLFTYAAENNDEIILTFGYAKPTRVSNYHFYNAPRNSNGQSQSFPTEDMISSFECTDGKLVNESSLYNPKSPFDNRDPRMSGAIILPRVWDGTTIRKKGTIFNNIEFMSSKENLYDAAGTTKLPTSLSEKEKFIVRPDGTVTTSANQEVTNAFSSFTGYCVYKYMVEENIADPNNTNIDFILCRYPEVLLTYAEASIELGQIDQSVLDAINMSRARAYGNTNASGATNINATNYPRITTTSQSELRKIVRRERKVELCFEGFRFEDLKRWGVLVKALNQRVNWGRPENFSMLSTTDIPVLDQDELVQLPYAGDKYGLKNEQTKLRRFEQFGTIPAHFNLLPIPLGEIQLNPKLTQNVGY